MFLLTKVILVFRQATKRTSEMDKFIAITKDQPSLLE